MCFDIFVTNEVSRFIGQRSTSVFLAASKWLHFDSYLANALSRRILAKDNHV